MATRKNNLGATVMNTGATIGGGFLASKIMDLIPLGSPVVKAAVVTALGAYAANSSKVKNSAIKAAGSGIMTVAGLQLLSSFTSGSAPVAGPDVILGNLDISDDDFGGGNFAQSGAEAQW